MNKYVKEIKAKIGDYKRYVPDCDESIQRADLSEVSDSKEVTLGRSFNIQEFTERGAEDFFEDVLIIKNHQISNRRNTHDPNYTNTTFRLKADASQESKCHWLDGYNKGNSAMPSKTPLVDPNKSNSMIESTEDVDNNKNLKSVISLQ